jgi:hypothetical protein
MIQSRWILLIVWVVVGFLYLAITDQHPISEAGAKLFVAVYLGTWVCIMLYGLVEIWNE